MKLKDLFGRTATKPDKLDDLNINDPVILRGPLYAVAHQDDERTYHLTGLARPESLHQQDGVNRKALCDADVNTSYCIVDDAQRLITFANVEYDDYYLCEECEQKALKVYKKAK